jgi:hypothetical protein
VSAASFLLHTAVNGDGVMTTMTVPGEPPPDQGTASPYPQAPQPGQDQDAGDEGPQGDEGDDA